jgi:serine/threonine protein kinase
VGSGATSLVFSAYQSDYSIKVKEDPSKYIPKEKDTKVAIKQIKRVFDHPRFAHAILREIRLLRILRGHPNVSQILDLTKIILDREAQDSHEAREPSQVF